MKIFVSSRSFEEYCQMFALTNADLTKSILDCAGGGSSFAFELSQRGENVVAVDIAYRNKPENLRELVLAGVEQTRKNIAVSPEQYNWNGFFSSPANHIKTREKSASTFMNDFSTAPSGRYLAADMQNLPFSGESFDLVLCSHLLFIYAESIDVNMHLRLIREMLRVTKYEVRIFPLVGFECDATETLATVLESADSLNAKAQIIPVSYSFFKNTGQMLSLTKMNC